MKVLYLCTRFPWPPDRGDRIRNLNNIRTLSKAHEVTLVCFQEGDAAGLEDALNGAVKVVHMVTLGRLDVLVGGILGTLQGMPLHVAYYQSRKLRRVVRHLAPGHDLVVANLMRTAPHCFGLDLPVVLDLTDSLALNYAQRSHIGSGTKAVYWSYEAFVTKFFERRLVRRFPHTVVCSQVDRDFIAMQTPGSTPVVVPNAVDTDFFAPDPTRVRPHTCVLTGTMDYLPNEDAARLFVNVILPRVRKHIPDAEFLIVGRSPSPAVSELGQVDGVTVTGAVPDIRPYLHQAAVFVAPLRIATGTQNKVLEAMATGVPVVTTDLVMRALGMGKDCGVWAHDDWDDFAAAIVRIMRNSALRFDMGASARRAVMATYSYPAVEQAFLGLVEQVVQAQPRS